MEFGAELVELDILSEDLNLARMIFPFEISYTTESSAERTRCREQAYQRLRRDGCMSRHGVLHRGITELLRVWAEPEVWITQVANVVQGDRRYRYRGAWRGRVGVMASQEGSGLTFSELRPAQVINGMVGLLPHWPPIDGPPETYLEGGDTVSQQEPEGDEFFGGISASPSINGFQKAERFFRAPVLRAGIISCWARKPGTTIRRFREVEIGSLTWYDTTDGRFFLVAEPLSDGATRYTITPADRTRIARWLHDKVNQQNGYRMH